MKLYSIREKDKNNDITQRRGKDKEKGISVQNIIILRNKKNKKKERKQSQFIEQSQFNLMNLEINLVEMKKYKL